MVIVDVQRTTAGPYMVFLLALAAVLASGGAAGANRGALTRRTPDPPAHSARGIHLVPTPASVIEQCRGVQTRAHFRMLCPRVLPRALIGWPGQPPPPLGSGLVRPSPRRIDGVDIGYGAPWENGSSPRPGPHLWRNRPCCFLHFVIQRGRPVTGARPAVLGGKSGRLLPASSSSYGGPYFGNHVRFFFRDRGVSYVATLHSFGNAATTALLGRLIAELRPVASLRLPAFPRPGTTVRIGSVGPRAIVAGPTALWVLGREQPIHPAAPWEGTRASLLALDHRTGAIRKRITVRGEVRGLAVGAGAVWVAVGRPLAQGSEQGVVERIDATGHLEAVVPTGTWPGALAVGKRAIWVVNTAPFYKRGMLVRIDAATNHVDGRSITLGPASSGAAVGDGSAWVADALEGTVRRVDPRRRRTVAVIDVGGDPYEVVFAAGSVWVTNADDGTVSRIDPVTNRVIATIRVGRNPYGIAVRGRSLWITNVGDGTVSQIDAAAGRVRRTIRTGGDPVGVAVAGDAVWYALNSEGLVTRLEPQS
jgi:YVTN family beta-propeller protein